MGQKWFIGVQHLDRHWKEDLEKQSSAGGSLVGISTGKVYKTKRNYYITNSVKLGNRFIHMAHKSTSRIRPLTTSLKRIKKVLKWTSTSVCILTAWGFLLLSLIWHIDLNTSYGIYWYHPIKAEYLHTIPPRILHLILGAFTQIINSQRTSLHTALTQSGYSSCYYTWTRGPNSQQIQQGARSLTSAVMLCPRRIKPLALRMQQGSHSDIITHSSATNPTILGVWARPATDDITGNGSRLQTVSRHISFTGGQKEILTQKWHKK